MKEFNLYLYIEYMKIFLRCVISIAFLMCTKVMSQALPFSFIALGDLPYGDTRRVENNYRKLIQSINSTGPVFSIHVGDFKTGSSECSNQEFKKQFDHFGLFENALIYTPGDNDWTDCHRFHGAFDQPLERLSALRSRFFSSQASMGKRPIILERQSNLYTEFSGFPENQRWVHNQVLFVTLHVVGSNNNYDPKMKDPKQVAEFTGRDDANIAWIRSSFQFVEAQKLSAIVFAFQGDVFIEKSSFELFPLSSGFKTSIGDNLLPLAAKANVPILIIHGDSHKFKFDQPFFIGDKRIVNLTRLEVPGAQDVRAVEVTVDIESASPFRAKLIGDAIDHPSQD